MTSIKDQPKPTSNSRLAVWDLVINDMQERDALGRHRYGTPLQPFNGRDALVDAYQEALDLAVYLRQAIEERNAVQPPVLEQVPERKTCERCGKHVGQNDWDIHTCTPPESKRPQPVRREKEVIHKEMGTLSWLDEDEFVGYWMKTTGRTRDLYAEQPKQKCWLCGDMDPAFQARCNVPACGMKEQPAQPQQEPIAVELVGVEEAIKEGNGFWKSCTGCYETNEGHPPTGAFFSSVFKCYMGHGCSECGGIGAIWDDTDYEAMADHMMRDDAAPQPAQRNPLTDEEIIKCWGQASGTRYGYVAFARAIEAAHGIKGDA